MEASLINDIKWLWQDDWYYDHYPLVTLLYSRTAAWTEQFHKHRWLQTCVVHGLSFDQAIIACSTSTSGVYLLPLQGLIVLFLTSQMKASLINENCGVVEACKKQREKRKKFSMGGLHMETDIVF